MRIVTIGPDPHLLTAIGKIHSWVIQHLHNQGHEIAVLAHTYDTNYFVPEENDSGKVMFCYKFLDKKVPVFPYKRGSNPPYDTEAVPIYELLDKLKPDLVISIDDFESVLFMQAVKMFLPDAFKWMWVLPNASLPLNEDAIPIIETVDSVLCTNKFTYDYLRDFYHRPNMDWCYPGADLTKYFYKNTKEPGFKIIWNGKNSLKDYLPGALCPCQEASRTVDLSLYVHINQMDGGFYNIDALKKRFDNGFISFPETPISIKDGCSDGEMNDLLNKNRIFLSTSLLSSSSIGLFEALAAGCIPMVNSQGSDFEIIKKEFPEEIEYLTYSSTGFIANGEKELRIPKIDDIIIKIIKAGELIKNKEKYKRILNKILGISKRYSCTGFLEKIDSLVQKTVRVENKVFKLT